MQGTILIVDDQEIGRFALEGMLLPLGHDLHFAQDGHEALAQLDRIRPDVVLLDVMMPDMDSYTVCRRIRATPRWRDVPVILVTALDDRQSRIQGIEAGADEFVSKPVDWTELRARVQTVISLGRTRRQLQERAKFEWAITHSSDGFLWLDDAGFCQMANPVAQRWLAWDAETPPACVWLDFIAQVFTVQPQANWPALRAATQPFQLTLVRPETPRVSALWLHVTASPWPSDEGGSTGWMVHLQDVTALQQHMQQTFTLFDLVSHKLRTTLTLIRGSLEVLGEGLLEKDSADWPVWRDILMNAVDRFALDTEQLLSTAMQISGGASRSGCGPQNVEEIAAAVQRACHEAGLPADHCTLRYAATGLPRLDLATLELILSQLLDNARKNHPQQEPQVQIAGRDDAGCGVLLEMEDDGPGIPPELQDQVWLPFYQIDRWQTGQTPGMGMGLAIVANHVWTAGGRCWIERGVRGGARICLTLPAAA